MYTSFSKKIIFSLALFCNLYKGFSICFRQAEPLLKAQKQGEPAGIGQPNYARKWERFSCYVTFWAASKWLVGLWARSLVISVVISSYTCIHYTGIMGVSQTYEGWTVWCSLVIFHGNKGYSSSNNHGSGKWIFWRLNSFSRAVFSTSSHSTLTPHVVAQANESTNHHQIS